MPINFCHIAPTAYLESVCSNQKYHLLLAHLVETDSNYVDYYNKLKSSVEGCAYIMDNAAFELYSQGLPMFDSSKLISLARKVGGVNYIVMSDYPGEPFTKTIQAAKELAPQFREQGFGTFFCPQSEIGDLEGLLTSYEFAANSPLVDYIGVSILAIPNAYRISKDNKLQRFLSRWSFMSLLEERGILQQIVANGKKLHFLGMLDGPKEISLVKPYHNYISSWDSSAAVWLGVNKRSFDISPTGLMQGKFEEPVDFDKALDLEGLPFIEDNKAFIDKLCV